MDTPSLLIGGSSVVTLVAISLVLLRFVGKTATEVIPQEYRNLIDTLVKSDQAKDHTIEAMQLSIRGLRAENDRCEERVDRLIEACRDAGVPIPAEMWRA